MPDNGTADVAGTGSDTVADRGTGSPRVQRRQQILCCTDGSQACESGLTAALGAMGSQPWDPTVLTVVAELDPTLVTGAGLAGPVMSEARFQSDTAALVDAGAQTALATADRLGLREARVVVDIGPAGPAICRRASEDVVTAIVMGTRGRSGVTRAVLGSVSDYVVRHAPCPVVVAGPHSLPAAGPVLVCLDDSPPARHAADTGLRLLPQQDIVFATVMDEPHVPVPYDGSSPAHSLVDAEERQRTEATGRARATAMLHGTATDLGRAARTEVLMGIPGPELCALATRLAARAIVVGTRGRGGVVRALLGSVSDYVVRNAPCPVVVVGPGTAPTAS